MNKIKEKDIYFVKNCVGCGVCSEICPKKCISMSEDEEGFVVPNIEKNQCIHCGKCYRECPQNKKLESTEATFYMAWNKNIEVLRESSSGGVFTALANLILEQQGAVVGAKFNSETKEVMHDIIYQNSELDKLRLSKYYQSMTQAVFTKVKELIKQERVVLFTGTACQIAALYAYLGEQKNSKFLYTMDVLCHGVANKQTVMAYIKDREKQYGKKISNFCFRVKEGKEGWQSGSGTRMKLFFEDGTSEIQDKFLDTYFVGFNSNIFLRKSCYECYYCGTKRIADFTVADFWGVSRDKVGEKQMREGVSVLLLNSEKAKKMISGLKKDLYIEKIEPMEAIPYNRAFVKPNCCPEGRTVFFSIMRKKGFDYAVKKLNKKYYRNKKIKSIMVKVLPKNCMEYIMNKRR